MTKYDLQEVRKFASDLNARIARCDNGEGAECASLDDALRHYASLCLEYLEKVRAWGREVFAGRVEFDEEVERVWKDEGLSLYRHAAGLLAFGEQAEIPCYILEGQQILQSALWSLKSHFEPWVTPSLAIAPSARTRLNFSPQEAEDIRNRIDALPPRPADWQPADPSQQFRYRLLLRERAARNARSLDSQS
jgi:hypothetical protein